MGALWRVSNFSFKFCVLILLPSCLEVINTSEICFISLSRVVLEAAPQLTSTQWLEGVALWRPAGMLQCFPIFSMALACQANVFEVRYRYFDTIYQLIDCINTKLFYYTVYIYLSIFLYIHPSFIYPSFIYPSFYLSTYLFICQSKSFSIVQHISINLSTYISIYQSSSVSISF